MTPSQMMNSKVGSTLPRVIVCVLCIFTVLFSPGCASIMSSATSSLMDHLSKSIINNDDLVLVETGAPAYLLMMDSLISKDPENEEMLSAAATLYSSYSEVFITDKQRSRKITQKAFAYANRAICIAQKDACNLKEKSYKEFNSIISKMKTQNVPTLFALGNAWAGWILANKNDFDAIADMARIEQIMLKIIELDPTYRDGTAYLYLGTMATLLPPALGGKPELGKQYFETALKLSQGKNLMVKVMYAKLYARMIFDRPLHDQLLNDVLNADPSVPGYILMNTYARQQAKELLASSEDYF